MAESGGREGYFFIILIFCLCVKQVNPQDICQPSRCMKLHQLPVIIELHHESDFLLFPVVCFHGWFAVEGLSNSLARQSLMWSQHKALLDQCFWKFLVLYRKCPRCNRVVILCWVHRQIDWSGNSAQYEILNPRIARLYFKLRCIMFCLLTDNNVKRIARVICSILLPNSFQWQAPYFIFHRSWENTVSCSIMLVLWWFQQLLLAFLLETFSR